MVKSAKILLAVLIFLALSVPSYGLPAAAQDQNPPDPADNRRWDGDGNPFDVMLRDDRYPEEALTQTRLREPFFAIPAGDAPPQEGFSSLSGAIAVAAGYSHTCALTSSGGVKCWGDNSNGKLGDGTTVNRLAPVNVVGLSSGVVAISSSHKHTCALTSAGGVKCWGYNLHGELGDGTTIQRSTPVDVVGLSSGVVAITAGGFHTCALLSGGALKCWGANWHGQVGDGSLTHRYTPVDVDFMSWGVKSVSAGKYTTCAVASDSRVKCWGYNMSGQVGDGTTTQRPQPVGVIGAGNGYVSVSLGALHSCALRSDGSVKCWGENKESQLGNGSRQDSYQAVSVSGLSSGVTAISGGGYFTCALLGASMKCWGSNWAGQIGDGSNIRRSSPVDVAGIAGSVATMEAGDAHTCATTGAGVLKCWGSNAFGQIGDGTTALRWAPVGVSGLSSGIASTTAGGMHSCALTSSGGVKCWGNNSYGQLGDGTNVDRISPVDVAGLSSGVVAVAAGEFHTCALLNNGSLKCWGWNKYGQVGDNSYTTRWAPVNVSGLTYNVLSVEAGDNHTCAVVADGSVKCWGDNYAGMLGTGDKNESPVPLKVKNLTGVITAVSAGTSHTCALTNGGALKCWGSNTYGKLGNGTTNNSLYPVDVSSLGGGVVAISVGADHSCALMSGGTVKCWGSNVFGQVGNGSGVQSETPVDVPGLSNVMALRAGGIHTCALISGGSVKCWGDNWTGQMADGTTIVRPTPGSVLGLARPATSLSSGYYHSCITDNAGAALCWGTNGNGQIGDGSLPWRVVPVDVVNLDVVQLAINYTTGKPGSYFTITGSNFPPGGSVTVEVNGSLLSAGLAVDSAGNISFRLNTTSAQAGRYAVTAGSIQKKTVGFSLIASAPLRSQQGTGPVLNVPAGIALTIPVFMPFFGK